VNGDYRVNDDAAARRKQLGRLLRRAREAVQPKLTQQAVAERLRCGQAKINKIETTLVRIDPPDLEKLIQLYQVTPDEAAELRTLVELDQQGGPPRTKYADTMTAFGTLSEVEPEAREIRCWHSERIPGPLQSEMYVLQQHGLSLADSSAITLVLREWTARSKVFTVPNPPSYRPILSESSFLRMPGGRNPQIVVDQADHLLRLMDAYDQLDLRILTFDADIRFVDSDFQHLMFAEDSRHCEFIYIEYPGGSRKCKAAYELEQCREHWADLSAAALDAAASREFLKGLIRSSQPPTL
jgi:transcriptional regulator with XRE-family HTH domain